MKIAASVILYHPDEELLRKNIAAFIDDVDTLILYRNSRETISLPEAYTSKLVELGNGENHYMAQALNECLEYCHQHGFHFLLTMDQDSVWEDFHGFINQVSKNLQENVVIYAPNVNHTLATDLPSCEVETTITSGSLHQVDLARRIGGYKDYYKIYWVDGEFCHRARKHGFKIMALPPYNLKQQFGKAKKTSIGGFFCADYSPMTYYFMFRNMIIMRREWSDNPSLKCIVYTLFLYLRSILLGEKDKIKKLKGIVRGLHNGLTIKLPDNY